MNWRDHVTARLQAIRPDSVFALDAAALELARDVLRDTPVYAPDNPPGRACPLALGVDALNGLDARQALHLIGQTRLYAAPRLLIAAQTGCVLDEAAFRALGFMLSTTEPVDGMRLYDYNLDTYKTVPDWLNARFWANPERWEP